MVKVSPPAPTEKEEQTPGSDVSWDVDQGLIAQLKEQYRKERKGKKGVKSEFLLQFLTSCLPAFPLATLTLN